MSEVPLSEQEWEIQKAEWGREGETLNAAWESARKVDVRLPGKGNSNSHEARPVY